MNSRSVVILLALLALGLVTTANAQDTDAEKQAIRDVIARYATATDQRNVEEAAAVMHEQHWHYAATPNGLLVISGEQYQTMLEAGQIGGVDRELIIDSITVTSDRMASAQIQLRAENAVFRHLFGLMKLDGSWKIMSILTLLEPRE